MSAAQCLLEARAHFIQAQAFANARDVTNRISGAYTLRGLNAERQHFNEELLAHESHPSTLWQIADSLVARGQLTAALEWVERMLDEAQRAGDEFEAARALQTWAVIDEWQGDSESARKKYLRIIRIRKDIGNVRGEADARLALATLNMQLGHREAARRGAREALKLAEPLADWQGEGNAYNLLGSYQRNRGKYAAAKREFEKMLALARNHGDLVTEATAWHQLGIIASDVGRKEGGLRLVAISALLLASVGSVELKPVRHSLAAKASALGIAPEDVQVIMNEVQASYEADGGDALLKAAFPDDA